MISRYSPKGRSQASSLTYYVLRPYRAWDDGISRPCDVLEAYDSATSALIASAETLEALEAKMLFLGYKINKETK